MLSPAFEMQYSPRFTEAVYAEMEVTKTMRPVAALHHPARRLLGQEMRPFQVGRDQLVEALFGGFQKVAALARRHAGVVHQQIQVAEALARERA